MTRFTRAAVVCALLAAAAPAVMASAQHAWSPVTPASERFRQHLLEYLALRRASVDQLQRRYPGRSEADDTFRLALGAAIRQARRDAHAGDILCPEMAVLVVAAVQRDLARRDVEERRAIFREVPDRPLVRVNDLYPAEAPLATIPPLLLQQLDPLPPELQYGFLGTSLILLDVDTRVIVDVVPHAVRGTT